MDGFRKPDRRSILAVLAGAALAALLYVPPFDLAEHIDWRLLDAWARIAPPAAPDSLVLVETQGASALAALTVLTGHRDARLIISTLSEPPAPAIAEHVLGPTELPVGERVLRRTGWNAGGHLWFRGSVGGIVREDTSVIPDHVPISSLATVAAAEAGGLAAPALDAGRQWLRFHDPRSFRRLEPASLAGADLRDAIVVIGAPRRDYATPLGPMSAAELVAQALAGRMSSQVLRVSPLHQGAAWLLAIALATVLVLRAPLTPLSGALAAGAGLLGLSAGSAIAFVELNVALPIAAPVAFLLAVSALLVGAARPAGAALGPGEPTPIDARRLVSEGRLVEAARAYRTLPLSTALLPEQYGLAEALEDAHEKSQALALFHRIAQTDVRYRDVASRLAKQYGNGDDDPELPRPETLGRYELIELIGQGTTGQVFLGRDPQINRLLAIKAINLRGDGSAEANAGALENFRREAESAGRLNHPNIVTIYDVGEVDGLAYIAMEYLKGRHLSDYCDADNLLPVHKVSELLAIAADALDYAHACNVVHRDIKPANIMYDSVLDELKITDFGIARLIDVSRTRTGIVLGTPSYMAPEQLEGENVNGHTDLFALGVTLYQLLTGRLPFRGASMTQLMYAIANEPHEPVTAIHPGLPGTLDGIVDRALAKHPSDRFASGAEMANALRSIAAGTN